jgi:hypothetical protein
MTQIPEALTDTVLAAIPANTRRVLELGCGLLALQQSFKAARPDVEWVVADTSQGIDLAKLGTGFDTVLLGPLLTAFTQPNVLLDALHELSTPQATLVCSLPNAAHISVVERLLMGDIGYQDGSLLAPDQARLLSPASAFKLLLDAGWLPELAGQADTGVPESVASARLLGSATALGLSRQMAERNLGMAHMVLRAGKQSLQGLAQGGRFTPFSVIVPVTNPLCFDLNIASSPGLREAGVDIIPVFGAHSAAQAYAEGAAQAQHPWRLLVQQEMYFPTGSGLAIAQQLGRLDANGQWLQPVGFVGLEAEIDLSTRLRHAGQLIEQHQAFDNEGSKMGVALHDGAVLLHRDSEVRIDPELGWHLWATDLCLQALKFSGGDAGAHILRAPLFLNGMRPGVPEPALQASARAVLAKHPEWHRIPTLSGLLTRQT